jgi:hypothetical protein
VTALTVDARGAQGGGSGGLGGHDASTIAVSGGQVYEIRVGGQPVRPNDGTGRYNGAFSAWGGRARFRFVAWLRV